MAAILGGGLGGLSTGYYLLKNCVNAHMKLALFEASDFYGGWIRSIRTNDYIFEQGPRTIRPKGPYGLNTLNMIQELGLSEHVSAVLPSHPAATTRMVCVGHTLHTLPSRFSQIFTKTKPFSKPLILAALHDLTQPGLELKDDSIYNFVSRRFGQELADYAVSPMICGICAGDAKEISVKFLMKTLFEYEQTHGGVLKGVVKNMFKPQPENEQALSELALKSQEERWSVYTLQGGLETLPETLKEHLVNNNVEVHSNSKIEEIEFVDSSSVLLRNKKGEILDLKHVYSAIPAHALAKLVARQHPHLSEQLEQIPFVNVGIVNLFFDSQETLIAPAFGFLVPPKENSPILGVVFDSCCNPEQKGTVLTVMLGGRWFKERFGDNITKDQLLAIAMKEVRSILKITMEPTVSHVNILEKCIPQYVIGHYDRVEYIRKYIKQHNLPLSLVGCSYDGVGINDVIYSAKAQVERDCTV
ncbi:hypothetical protein JYU34_006296 [Plutella xylostella]|uniref:Protoporphyrinogen oxidase n=1 Tax=Plutella xylostella TaxID=51655 RepID=A0ABQ7QRN9_PLUXY|nr:protoporphyrinogen oxidase [Plutella xylostella]KAG7307725.1 hypothetical protein JYU34_006296 [Plutella xylostella]